MFLKFVNALALLRKTLERLGTSCEFLRMVGIWQHLSPFFHSGLALCAEASRKQIWLSRKLSGARSSSWAFELPPPHQCTNIRCWQIASCWTPIPPPPGERHLKQWVLIRAPMLFVASPRRAMLCQGITYHSKLSLQVVPVCSTLASAIPCYSILFHALPCSSMALHASMGCHCYSMLFEATPHSSCYSMLFLGSVCCSMLFCAALRSCQLFQPIPRNARQQASPRCSTLILLFHVAWCSMLLHSKP